MSVVKELYEKIFEAGCVKFGEFKLKSGILSPVYVDFRGLISKPKLLSEVGQALATKVKEIGCDRIAGIPYAGLPLGVAASIAGDIPMIYTRREVKEYGTGKLIEGDYTPGERILVVDDIVTDGRSKVESITPLTARGLVVHDILVILDREQGGKQLLEKAGYQLHSLGTLTEVLNTLVEVKKVSSVTAERVQDFIKENQFK